MQVLPSRFPAGYRCVSLRLLKMGHGALYELPTVQVRSRNRSIPPQQRMFHTFPLHFLPCPPRTRRVPVKHLLKHICSGCQAEGHSQAIQLQALIAAKAYPYFIRFAVRKTCTSSQPLKGGDEAGTTYPSVVKARTSDTPSMLISSFPMAL
jgi:hypothetical protein